jgi:hypothetical protein
MRVPAGALTEAACSVEAYLPLHRPLDDGVLHDRCDVWRISARLSPPGARSWFGMFVERSVSLPARRVLGDPP